MILYMCDYFETYGIFSYGKDLNMSVFQLLNSPVSEVDGAAKLFDIQARPIKTKHAIAAAELSALVFFKALL